MKLCLIGSTRFRDEYIELNKMLSRMGHVVYTVAFYKEPTEISAADKEILDLVHLRKISESEGVVLVTDATGYVGDSTRREFAWASINGIPIYDGRKFKGETEDSIPVRLHEALIETKSIDAARLRTRGEESQSASDFLDRLRMGDFGAAEEEPN